jgi:DivIVA domain-containing protein
MALTPEDVVNKRFQSTKFREGYDQDEVDDFLDEVVVEMRRLVAENDELSKKIAASESRIAELQRSGGSAGTVGVAPAVVAPIEGVDTENANNLLQLARRLHEEHVREGIQKRDELIAEGHAQAARIVAEAETEHRAHVQALETERFEREYRSSLTSFITNQLRSLESTSAPSGPPTA